MSGGGQKDSEAGRVRGAAGAAPAGARAREGGRGRARGRGSGGARGRARAYCFCLTRGPRRTFGTFGCERGCLSRGLGCGGVRALLPVRRRNFWLTFVSAHSVPGPRSHASLGSRQVLLSDARESRRRCHLRFADGEVRPREGEPRR